MKKIFFVKDFFDKIIEEILIKLVENDTQEK